MGKTLTKDGLTMSQASLGKKQFAIKLLESLTTDIFEFTALEQIPHAFLRIEFGRISRQAFQMDALGCTSRQKVLDGLGAMNAGSIPNNEQVARDFAQKHFQKADHVGTLV